MGRGRGTPGLEDSGTPGHGTRGRGDAGTWGRGTQGRGTREGDKQTIQHLNFVLNLQCTGFGG